MGLTLIHGNSQPNTKPRVFVVAETSVHSALTSDLGLDVHPELFDYESFVKASMSKTISTNSAIVVLSDALSQRVVPLEAVIALVRSNVVLIPWKSSEEEIIKLNVAVTSPRPTPNTLRRVIFAHTGLQDQPPRFDGDDYIEEPPDASVMNFSPQGVDPQYAPPQTQTEEQNIQEEPIANDRSASPLDWFSDQPQPQNPTVAPETSYAPTVETVIDPISEPEIQEAQVVQEEPQAFVEPPQDAPSFLPEFFTPDSTPSDETEVAQSPAQTNTQTPAQQPSETKSDYKDINSFWDSTPTPSSSTEPETQDRWVSPALTTTAAISTTPTTPTTTPTPTPETQNDMWGAPQQSPAPSQHPYADSDSLELEAYVNSTSDESAYDFDDSTPASFVPDVAFSNPDSSGSQQMWTMFDAGNDHLTQQTPLSEYPDGTDHRKAISLAEPLVLCVYSPKGGVGKTSISVNLAARLAYTTRLQVCIVDLDIAFGNVGTRLGLYNPTVRELLNETHIDGESLARNLVYDRRSGLFSLLAPLRPETGVNRRKFSPAAYKKILSLLKERFDVVILDCPVELRDPLVSGFALTQANKIVMVVNNEQATLLDARRAVEAMCRPKDSQRLPGLGLDPTTVGLVVNQKVENVGREVDDIKAILGGGDPNHPSKKIEILSVIADDRQLWVGNANMARTVATSGENDVDQLLDDIWAKILPNEAAQEFESQEFQEGYTNPLDAILSPVKAGNSKKKKRFNIFKGDK